MEFNEFVRNRAKELGLSITKVAERANLTRPGIYKLLNEDVKEAKLSTLVQLARALEVHEFVLLRTIFYKIKPPPSRMKSKYRGDYSVFIEDVTYPDNETVTAGSEFEKVWRIQNLGSVTWENRRLICVDEEILCFRIHGEDLIPLDKIDLVPLQKEVPIATTRPDEAVDISVIFRAPIYPCTVISYWKMVDVEGEECFPQLRGLYCKVRVVAL